MVKMAPSVLGADFSRLGDEIVDAQRVGADMLHLDIMDGHFVPNISFGPGVVGTINRLTGLFLDVHLMLTQPEKYFEPFVDAGADAITFHIEVHPDPVAHAGRIRELGAKTGISLNPDTPFSKVAPFLEYFDFLLIMSVFPGFGGQGFIESALTKITQARKQIGSAGIGTLIMVDGGVDGGNAEKVVAAGADILVMGSGFFSSRDRAALVQQVHGL